MLKSDFLKALELLGEELKRPVTIVIGGGAALLLLDLVARRTKDVDVVESSISISRIRQEIEAVAKKLEMPKEWLNDDAAAWRRFLLPDFHERLEDIANFGKLTVRALGRQELILMKIIAGRGGDLGDLKKIAPSKEELQVVRNHVERLRRIDIETATFVEDYLDLVESNQLHEKTDQLRRPGIHG